MPLQERISPAGAFCRWGNDKQVNSTSEQVEETKESKEIVEEMASSIQLIASSTQDISTNAIGTSQKALEGNEAIQSTIKQMRKLQPQQIRWLI